MPGDRSFIRENAFLVAAVALPALVVAFFLLASAVPNWTVPPPSYDVLLRGYRPYDGNHQLKVAYDLDVRDGQVQLTIRPLATQQYMQKPALFLFDHKTLNVREIPLNLTETPPETPETTIVDAVPGRRLLLDSTSPDGYTLQPRPYRNGGIMGDLFGMHSYQAGMVLIKRGRVVPVTLPEPFESQSAAYFMAWVTDGGR